MGSNSSSSESGRMTSIMKYAGFNKEYKCKCIELDLTNKRILKIEYSEHPMTKNWVRKVTTFVNPYNYFVYLP